MHERSSLGPCPVPITVAGLCGVTSFPSIILHGAEGLLPRCDLLSRYDSGKILGAGSFGIVREAVGRRTGAQARTNFISGILLRIT